MRLIDAGSILKRAEESFKNAGLHGEDYRKFKKWLRATPTIDAVEVVRCKDCRHANECHKSVQYTRHELNTVTIGYSPIEWCSRGERREE